MHVTGIEIRGRTEWNQWRPHFRGHDTRHRTEDGKPAEEATRYVLVAVATEHAVYSWAIDVQTDNMVDGPFELNCFIDGFMFRTATFDEKPVYKALGGPRIMRRVRAFLRGLGQSGLAWKRPVPKSRMKDRRGRSLNPSR